MKEQVYAPDPLNEQASILVDAQTDIKTAIKQGVLSGKGKTTVKDEITRIINRAVARIRSPTLQADGRVSLMRFADRAYAQFTAGLTPIPFYLLPFVVTLMRSITAQDGNTSEYKPSTPTEMRAAREVASADGLSYTAYNKGIPLQEFQKRYIDKVTKALDGLAESNALDPNDFSGRNSLRNLAEMQVRYERHQQEIADLKTRGARLVVCSVHADCSDRCAPWQGGVYSLDGTEGYTEDGKYFQPLENATDIYYTTKAGRVYKNGLLGFNCRHKLFEYQPGMVIPTVDGETQKREYGITKLQRQLERGVIEAREKALAYKGADIKKYRIWRNEAARRYNMYKAFSIEHKRAFYPDRVKIL